MRARNSSPRSPATGPFLPLRCTLGTAMPRSRVGRVMSSSLLKQLTQSFQPRSSACA